MLARLDMRRRESLRHGNRQNDVEKTLEIVSGLSMILDDPAIRRHARRDDVNPSPTISKQIDFKDRNTPTIDGRLRSSSSLRSHIE